MTHIILHFSMIAFYASVRRKPDRNQNTNQARTRGTRKSQILRKYLWNTSNTISLEQNVELSHGNHHAIRGADSDINEEPRDYICLGSATQTNRTHQKGTETSDTYSHVESTYNSQSLWSRRIRIHCPKSRMPRYVTMTIHTRMMRARSYRWCVLCLWVSGSGWLLYFISASY